MKTKRNFKFVLIIVLLAIIGGLAGCALIKDKLAVLRGDLIGDNFVISVYDHYANKTLELEGSKITVGLFENEANDNPDSTGFESSVLEITINGNQMLQVGNTVIFAEKGLDMVEDYEVPTDIDVNNGGGFVPLDRFINDLKNDIGKEKTIIISSQMGIPLGVYQGEDVYVTVPENLPKMTRLNIDGNSLYIHRANYVILDSNMIN
ncbi:DUF5052 family protein [Tissierella sp. Yu-01]|uniref:DUF5052 family protein n=1 Tax=Tissierella sp. Yu-01 TaxID=3035694 RepID=UPI00240D7E4B|nr:DUF5052 family protein [Tissierella sp. Yu-01]WFA08824.1 DUF5052 family protein [Tissierella sp. Yu-01]